MNRPLTYPNCCFNRFAEVMDPLNLNCAKTARAAKIESTLDEYEDENALLYFRELSDLYNISASTLQRLGTIKNCAKYQLNFSYFFTILYCLHSRSLKKRIALRESGEVRTTLVPKKYYGRKKLVSDNIISKVTEMNRAVNLSGASLSRSKIIEMIEIERIAI